MKSKTILLFFFSGYIYGVLLLNVCQCFPTQNFELRSNQYDKTDKSSSQNVPVKDSFHDSLSLLDITAFIDQYSLSQSSLSQNHVETKRNRRSINKDFDREHVLSENFLTNDDVQEGNAENDQNNLLLSNNQAPNGLNQQISENSRFPLKTSSSRESGPPESNEQSQVNTRSNQHGTPQYMLDLFSRFQNDPFSQPASNIVRSFFNEATSTDQLTYNLAYIACIEERGFDRCPRVHHLKFDVTSVPDHEHITMAELRLYKIVERDRRRYYGVNRKVEVVEMIRTSNPQLDVNRTNQEIIQRTILDSRPIIGRKSGWETFFITQAIRRWVKSGASLIHELEIYIENIAEETELDFMDFEQISMTTNEPLLIVFSDDTSKHHKLEHNEELQELLSHRSNENDAVGPIGASNAEIFQRHAASHELVREENILNRKKRSVYNPCHLERMYVNFEEIGYDSWIINPKGYPAGHCVGTCDFPFHRLSVSPHGVIQSQMNSHYSAQFQKPCCVPIKLGPISLLYIEKNSLTYKYNYEGMQVLECGCR